MSTCQCDNYRAPTTCLTAPSSEAGRCDKCRVMSACLRPGCPHDAVEGGLCVKCADDMWGGPIR
jgi:hypothetical protein